MSITSKNTKTEILSAYQALLVESQALKLELETCEHELQAESTRANQLEIDLSYAEEEVSARDLTLSMSEEEVEAREEVATTPVYTTSNAVKLHDDLVATGSRYFNSGRFFIAARRDHFALVVQGVADRVYKREHISQLMDWAHADV